MTTNTRTEVRILRLGWSSRANPGAATEVVAVAVSGCRLTVQAEAGPEVR